MRLLIIILTIFGFSVHADDFIDGKLAYDEKQYQAAMQKLKPLANAGNSEAQWMVGMMYSKGNEVNKNESLALQYYKKAAQSNFPHAQTSLGWYYLQGKGGLNKDYTKAKYWFEKGIENNSLNAYGNLAYMYKEGFGVKRDVKKYFELNAKGALAGSLWSQRFFCNNWNGVYDAKFAIKQCQSAADRNDLKAMKEMGRNLTQGTHISINYDTAAEYYESAYQLGDNESAYYLNYLYTAFIDNRDKSNEYAVIVKKLENERLYEGSSAKEAKQKFIRENPICIRGNIVYEDKIMVQCLIKDNHGNNYVRATFNSGYDITTTIFSNNNIYSKQQRDFLSVSILESLLLGRYKPQVANKASNLISQIPLSADDKGINLGGANIKTSTKKSQLIYSSYSATVNITSAFEL